MGRKQIIVLVGPSGSGKTTIGQYLSQAGYLKLVTTTTRPPRANEKDGVDYFFEDVAHMAPEDFVEQTSYNGYRYGLTKKEIENKLKDTDVVHLAMDQRGAAAVKANFPQETAVIYIQMTPEQLKERMLQRGESPAFIARRLNYCQETEELTPLACADLCIKNKDIAQVVEEILQFIEQRKEDPSL
ncbi:guanylate kinase [Allofustis seminis]|uniref:guanylate kinase n=1 Tax=Allofustis seminis TaxID=166939 RepID=UPI00037F4A4B|nr:AAA family ATPase [Allofustis seminis]